MSLVAITRDISPRLAACELTNIPRTPIDLVLAHRQHEAYRSLLTELGCDVRALPALSEFPDAVFVEDVAVVIGDAIVLTRPGAASRRGEVAYLEDTLREFAPLERIDAPGTVDGGDVLVQERDVFVGLTSRTNRAGIEQLAMIVEPRGFNVRAIEVRGCLHLKSAATSIGPDRLLANPEWVDDENLAPYDVMTVDPSEPDGANALRIVDTVVYPTRFPRTAERLRESGLDLRLLDNSELAKAEGALTCCSLLVMR
jgi:dimethylargininase